MREDSLKVQGIFALVIFKLPSAGALLRHTGVDGSGLDEFLFNGRILYSFLGAVKSAAKELGLDAYLPGALDALRRSCGGAMNLNNWALDCLAMGRFEELHDACRRAVRIYDQHVGPEMDRKCTS